MRHHLGFRRYAKNTIWMMLEQVLRVLVGFFIGIWLARYLGVKDYGTLSYVLAILAISAIIPKLGMDNIIVRELISSPTQKEIILSTSFWLKLSASILTILSVIIFTPLFETGENTRWLIIIANLSLLFQSFDIFDFYFQAIVESKYVSICKIIQLAVSGIIKTIMIVLNFPLISFIAILIFDQLLLGICLNIAFKIKGERSSFKKFSPEVAKRLLKSSIPLLLSSFVIMIYMRIDQIMIKEMLSTTEVGIYSVAVRIAEVSYFIPVIISNSLFPAILNAKSISIELFHSRLQKLYTFLVLISLANAIFIHFFGDFLITQLFGNKYIASGLTLKILSWSGIFVYMGVASNGWAISEGLQILSFYKTLTGALINITLNIVLIKNYGIEGAAIATLISYFVAGFIFDAFLKKTRINFYFKLKTLLLRWQ